MAKTLSIVVPYLSKSSCIDTCRRLIEQNTEADYEIVEIVDCTNVFRAYNEGAAKSSGDILALLNDDMFVAPEWDKLLIESAKDRTVVTTYLVESGRHAVNHRNIHRDFGRTAESFDYNGFAAFARAHAEEVPASQPGLGWYMPMAMRRVDFIPYPREDSKIPCDFLLFGIFASRNYQFVKARSYAYHLQRMTEGW